MAKAPLPRRCGLYLPGHEVHWIQGLRSGNDTEHVPAPGNLLAVEDDGIVTVEIDGAEHRFWNHDGERIARLARRAKMQIAVNWHWRLLRVQSKVGGHLFYIADPDDHLPCPAQPPSGDPIELLRATGGFTITGREAMEWLGR